MESGNFPHYILYPWIFEHQVYLLLELRMVHLDLNYSFSGKKTHRDRIKDAQTPTILAHIPLTGREQEAEFTLTCLQLFNRLLPCIPS